ncbi:MAG TPA: alpha/beta hydrolase [Stellaceae bacterium]
MSLQAELVRIWLRWSMKRSNHPNVTIEERRRRLAAYERLVPRPPRWIETAQRPLGGIPATRFGERGSRTERHILFLHGGAYTTGSAALYRHMLWRIAFAAAARIAAIDYRLAPEHRFPAALDDAVAAWRGLLAEGAEPRHCAVMGDSAGGGLTLALMLKLRDTGLPLPAATVALSPWTDLAMTGASLTRNAANDPMENPDDVPFLVRCYLNEDDTRNPYASPLYGDPKGLPPTLIQVGSDEILRDDSIRMAARMRQAGCEVELQVWPRMPHVWHAFAPLMPEARTAIAELGAFIRRHTPTADAKPA